MSKIKKNTFEVFLTFGLIMALIWLLPDDKLIALIAGSTVIFLIFISWHYHKDTLYDVGLLPKDYSQAKFVLLFVIVSLTALALIGNFIKPEFWKTADFWENFSDRLKRYIGWAFLQQLLFLGYFVSRLDKVFKKRWHTIIIASVLFSLAHLPNPILTAGCLFLSIANSYFFLKSRNLFLLLVPHAILATATLYLIADSLLDHPMRIGPHFWK